MTLLKMWPLMIYFLMAGVHLYEGTPTFSPEKTKSAEQPCQNGGKYPLQFLMHNREEKEHTPETDTLQDPVPPKQGRQKARGLAPSMEMMDQKRHPKPKRPMGNDIGTARELGTTVQRLSNGYTMNISSSPPSTTDHLEATVSVGFTMSTTNLTHPARDEESLVVSRELQKIIDSVPTLPTLHIPNLYFHKDPEEEAINQRITEVARQLAESAMRKEYEEGKLEPLVPLPKEKSEVVANVNPETNTKIHPQQTMQLPSDLPQKEKAIINPIVATSPSTEEKPPKQTSQSKPEKSGKSFVVSSTLPLVSHMPQETAQLQLIAEVQQVPHFMVQEGFHPNTPAPELIGPLLGGPPLKPEDIEEQRTAKSIDVSKPEPPTPFYTVRLPVFLKIVPPRFKLNELEMRVPVNRGYYPAFMAEGWWPRPNFKPSAPQT